MPLLDTVDIEILRTAQESTLPDSCAVKRRTSTANTTGGFVETWPATTYTYACRISVNGIPDSFLQMAAERRRTPYILTLAHDADVQISDRLVIGGKTLGVIGFASVGTWQSALRVVAFEVV